VISHNLDNGSSTGASRDCAIVISRKPNNGGFMGGIFRRSKAATNDSKTNDAQHPPVHLLLWRKLSLLGEGDQHHLIYVGGPLARHQTLDSRADL
jgi:hypothetical protein